MAFAEVDRAECSAEILVGAPGGTGVLGASAEAAEGRYGEPLVRPGIAPNAPTGLLESYRGIAGTLRSAQR
jgi:hypothetical protein